MTQRIDTKRAPRKTNRTPENKASNTKPVEIVNNAEEGEWITAQKQAKKTPPPKNKPKTPTSSKPTSHAKQSPNTLPTPQSTPVLPHDDSVVFAPSLLKKLEKYKTKQEFIFGTPETTPILQFATSPDTEQVVPNLENNTHETGSPNKEEAFMEPMLEPVEPPIPVMPPIPPMPFYMYPQPPFYPMGVPLFVPPGKQQQELTITLDDRSIEPVVIPSPSEEVTQDNIVRIQPKVEAFLSSWLARQPKPKNMDFNPKEAKEFLEQRWAKALQSVSATVSPERLASVSHQDSIASAVSAAQNGADRVELCSDLLEGGLTPSYGTIKKCMQEFSRISTKCQVMVMIRPRGGDFCYSELEFESMKFDVEAAKECGVHGVVFGILNKDATVDVDRTQELVKLAGGIQVTFHRAIDVTRDALEAYDTLTRIPGITRILTSGHAKSVLEGINVIKEFLKRGKMDVLAGGGVTPTTLPFILHHVQPMELKEIHMTAMTTIPSPMEYKNSGLYMGGVLRPPEYELSVPDPSKISKIFDVLNA